MSTTADTLFRNIVTMSNKKAQLLVLVLLLSQCLFCKGNEVVISSPARDSTIAAGVPIDVLGNGSSIVVSIAEAEWAWQYRPWLVSALAALVVSLSGVFPLVLIPLGFDGDASKSRNGGNGNTLRVLLSFAVGGLLGDVFLHLLPEAWATLPPPHSENLAKAHFIARCNVQHIWTGMWVLVGMLVFIIVEKCCSSDPEEKVEDSGMNSKKQHEELNKTVNNNVLKTNGNAQVSVYSAKKGNGSEIENHSEKAVHAPPKKVAGYLNLVANSIDNFTHGLAVGGGFTLSLRVGIFTTLAILIHEVPHEIGDFAILLRSGFSRWDAARAQLLTGSAGILGALAASIGAAAPDEVGVSWIQPFTAGGFLHIALVSVLPELVSESDPRESAKQLIGLAAGILLMAALTIYVES